MHNQYMHHHTYIHTNTNQGIEVSYTTYTERPMLPDCTPPEFSLFSDCSPIPKVEPHQKDSGSITREGLYDNCAYVQYDIRAETGSNLILNIDKLYINYYWSSFVYIYVCENSTETCPRSAILTGLHVPKCVYFSNVGRIKVEFFASSNEFDDLYGIPWANFSFSWNNTAPANSTETGRQQSVCVPWEIHNITDSEGTIKHVFPPQIGYPSNSNHTWNIQPLKPTESFTFEFVAFETEFDFDILYIYGCNTQDGKCKLARKLSGREQPCNVTVNAPNARVKFISDPYFGSRGFYIRFTTSSEPSATPTLCSNPLICPNGNAGYKVPPPKLQWDTLCCKDDAKNFKYQGNFWGSYSLKAGQADAYVVYTAGTAEGSPDCTDSEEELNSMYLNTTNTVVFDVSNFLPGALSWLSVGSASSKYNARLGLKQKVWVPGNVNSYGPLLAPEINKNGSTANLHITAATCVPTWHPFGTKWITSSRVLSKAMQFVSPPSIVVTATIPFVSLDYFNATGTQAEMANLTVSEEKDNSRPAVIMSKAILSGLSLQDTPWRAYIKRVTAKVSVSIHA
jgi:hypothetical protein